MPPPSRGELPIIQATLDLIRWFVPLLNGLPRSHQFALGDLLSANLYDLLEGLLEARYSRQRLAILEPVAARVDLLRRSRFWRSWIPASIEPLPTIRFHVGPFRQLRIRG